MTAEDYMDGVDDALNILRDKAHGIAVDRGWWEPREGGEVEINGVGIGIDSQIHRSFGELLMLVVCEAAEAMEAWREGAGVAEERGRWLSTPTSHSLPDITYIGEQMAFYYGTPQQRDVTDDDFRKAGFIFKPSGIPSELADIIIRVLDICGAYGVDIGAAVRDKMEYNKIREERHGGKRA